MAYAGVDLHKSFCQTIVCTKEGELIKEGRIKTEKIDAKTLAELLRRNLLPTISTIKPYMKELLTNLIDNGLKFNESEKPRVEVSCEEREKEKDYLFKVKDNGIGIEEEYQDKIFNLFVRAPLQLEYGGGTGVGLAICKRIITEFGGTIWVESKPGEGEGSTFLFTFPKLYQYFESAQ